MVDRTVDINTMRLHVKETRQPDWARLDRPGRWIRAVSDQIG